MLKGLSFVCLLFLLFCLPLEALEHDEEEIKTRQLQDANADGSTITVVFQTDQAPEEISWILFDSNTGVLINLVGQGSYSGPNSTESVTLPVTEGHSYTLQIMDSAKNGICCSNGQGSVTVYLGAQASGDSILVLSDGKFGAQLFLSFEASSSATLFFEPSTAPSLPPTDTSNPSSRPSMVPSVSPGPTITAAPSMDVVMVVITVAILTDQFPEEISWRLVGDTDGAVLREVPHGTYVTQFVRELTTVVVTGGRRYSLVVEDLALDGICCFYGDGEVRVFLGFPDASPLAYSGGDYSSGVTLGFEASTSGIISVPPPAPTPAPAAPSSSTTCQGLPLPEDGCAVCGPDMCVGNPDAIFTFPGQPPLACSLLENIGFLGGFIPPEDCPLIPPLAAGVCDCQPAAPSQPSFRPPAAPSASMGPCPFVPFGGCSICGPGKCVGNPNGIFAFPGQPIYFCDGFEQVGLTGGIPLDQCPFLPSLVDNDCGCRFSETPPSAGAPITLAPIFFGSPVSPPAFAPTPSCPAVPSGGCSICGSGMCVGNPDAIFTFPGQPTFLCGELQESGYAGLVPPDQCPFLPGIVFDICECRFGQTPPPVASPTTSCPPVPSNGCSICGPDQCVGNPDAIFEFPGQPVATCRQVEEAGLIGNIPLDQCPFIAPLLSDLCECRSASTFCPDVGAGCEVCGAGKCVGNPNAIFSFPGQPPVSCGQLEQQGIGGLIPFESCGFLPSLIDIVCGCTAGGETPTPPPVEPPTSCPAVPSTGCAVCGSDRCVGNPDAIFEFPGQPPVSCGILEDFGLTGNVPLDVCSLLPPLIDSMCGCISSETPPPPTACPADPGRGCSVCGPGMCVGNPDAIFEFPGMPIVTCGVLQEAGFDGLIPLEQCPLLPPILDEMCDCRFGETLPSVSPFAAPPGNASPLVFVGLDACKSSPCGICEGDCDSDFECGAGLKCFNRRTFSDPLPPGCVDSGSFFVDDFDFCYDESAPPVIPPAFAPTDPPFTMAPNLSPAFFPVFAPNSLPPNTVSPVAPAAPTSSLPLVFLGLDGCSESDPCGPCEGDCDSDDDCGPGLQCFTRTGSFDPLPEGCFDSGRFDIADYDFCYGETTPPGETTLPGGSCPPILPGGCSVCGEGKCVGNPSGEVEIVGQPLPLRCDDMEALGASGFIASDECLLMSTTIVNDNCGCRPGEASTTSAPAPQATDVPQTDVPQTEPPVAPAPVTEVPVTEVPEISTDSGQ